MMSQDNFPLSLPLASKARSELFNESSPFCGNSVASIIYLLLPPMLPHSFPLAQLRQILSGKRKGERLQPTLNSSLTGRFGLW